MSAQSRIRLPSAKRLMHLTAALLLVVPTLGIAQAQGALQEDGRYVVDGDCRRLNTSIINLWRWRKRGVLRNMHYLLVLQDLADSIDLGHLLPTARVRSSDTGIRRGDYNARQTVETSRG